MEEFERCLLGRFSLGAEAHDGGGMEDQGCPIAAVQHLQAVLAPSSWLNSQILLHATAAMVQTRPAQTAGEVLVAERGVFWRQDAVECARYHTVPQYIVP